MNTLLTNIDSTISVITFTLGLAMGSAALFLGLYLAAKKTDKEVKY